MRWRLLSLAGAAAAASALASNLGLPSGGAEVGPVDPALGVAGTLAFLAALGVAAAREEYVRRNLPTILVGYVAMILMSQALGEPSLGVMIVGFLLAFLMLATGFTRERRELGLAAAALVLLLLLLLSLIHI